MPLEIHALFFDVKVDGVENKWNIFTSSSFTDSSVWSLNRIFVEYFLCCHMEMPNEWKTDGIFFLQLLMA